MFCDIHGLDLPCNQCAKDRADDLDYLRKIEDYLAKEASE